MSTLMENSPLLEGYWTKNELARALGRTTRTIDRWHLLRIGPRRTKVKKLILYLRADVEKWLASHAEGE